MSLTWKKIILLIYIYLGVAGCTSYYQATRTVRITEGIRYDLYENSGFRAVHYIYRKPTVEDFEFIKELNCMDTVVLGKSAITFRHHGNDEVIIDELKNFYYYVDIKQDSIYFIGNDFPYLKN